MELKSKFEEAVEKANLAKKIIVLKNEELLELYSLFPPYYIIEVLINKC